MDILGEGKVFFIGGGPGDPELLTLKAKRIIDSADVIIYADSLVHPSVCDGAKHGARIIGSKTMTLDEITETMIAAAREGKLVARVQSGDPSIYGAVLEQMRLLESAGVDYEIVPGVSAAFAAAAVLKTEFTVPEVSQTVIFTRLEGRVAMPSGEELRDLAAHGCTLVLFLSITRINKVVSELKAGGAYHDDTPVAVVYRVGWEDELVITGTLGDIAPKVKRAGITLQALVLVGAAFDTDIRQLEAAGTAATSHLYSSNYTHLYRRAVDFAKSEAVHHRASNG
ncbi:MAG: precorrin-4 C(11)-methyltransferase [Chloroflexi bacterium]|nr:precorrin-4 C(11)-methyltransferase [Chloroflexota bacterium]